MNLHITQSAYRSRTWQNVCAVPNGSVKDWLSGKKKMPWWIPELLRLQRMEAVERSRQMNMTPIVKRHNLPTAKIVNFRIRKKTITISDQSEVADSIQLRA